ncbi:SMI1/KNR4 family protein [Myroides injenensis]|uniref:SMI1/KNR4 family protein n=1 Tax=Myroides injenensis TaxID=1183151 RepID=UPI0002888217|nr:SMI1/KNR4 family protein [Myroides injenensis]
MIDKLIETLRKLGWQVAEKNNSLVLKSLFTDRYSVLPDEFQLYLKSIQSGTSAENNAWLLCEEEYNGDSNDAFRWNELELLSLENADNEIDLQENIKSFWNSHLPFIISVKGEYSCFSIGTGEANYGQIFYGTEPEFEEVTLVAASLSDFISKLEKQALLFQKDYPYNLFF